MSHQVRRRKQVAGDIIEIYRYLHARSPSAADKVLDAIERSIKSLVDTPRIGSYWNSPDVRLDGMRVTTVTPYRNYLIFFRPVKDGVEVYRVLHGARNLPALIDEIDLDEDD
jgi:toxin ParE1/3/4